MSEDTQVTSAKKKRFLPKLGVKRSLMLLVVLGSIGTAVFYWNEANQARSETPEAIAARNQEESQRVSTALEKILLTESENPPTVARVEDANVLREANPDFYKNIEVGDYLVLFPQRAVIYREAENRIINVAPIINTAQLNQGTPTLPEGIDEVTEDQ